MPRLNPARLLTGWPPAFLVLLGASLLVSTASGASAPLLSLYVERELGGSETVVGIVVSAGWVFSLTSALLCGPLVDRQGRRRWSMIGLGTGLLGMLGLLVADSGTQTFIARAVGGIGGGITGVTIMAWALDSVPADRRGRALSAFGVSVWVGLSIGPQIGHLALDLGGYDAVWISLAGLYVAAFAVALTMREVHRPRVREKGDPPAERGLRRLLPRGAGRPTLSIAMASYGEGVMSAFLVLHLVGRGVGESAAASVFTVFAVCVLVPRLLGARLIDRFPPRRLSAVALVLDGVGLAILGFSSSFLAAAAGAAVMGFGFAVLYPSLALIATDAAGPERRGAALGAFAAAFSLGLAGGGLISGPVAELTGTGGAFLLAAGSAGLGAVVILGGGMHRPPRPEPVVEPWPAA